MEDPALFQPSIPSTQSKYTDLHPQFITTNSTHEIVHLEYHTLKGASESTFGAAEVLIDLGENVGLWNVW